MNVRNIGDAHDWFEVLVTGDAAQAAVMDLQPGGGESGEKGNEHAGSEQVLFVVDGEVEAEIGDERRTLRGGDVVIVPRGVPHRFTNRGDRPARTLNVYGPPAY
jgi:mannose-6-phosphate isomerase-like protein (cupin superfamily)